MSYPPPYQGPRYPDPYATATPTHSAASTPHIPQSAQLPGGYTQWEPQHQDPTIHDYQAHTGLSHSPLDSLTPMQTPTSTSFTQMEIELEEPPMLVQSQPHRLSVSGSQHGSPVDNAPILLRHPSQMQQQQPFQQHLYPYGLITPQEQHQFALELDQHLEQQQQHQQLSRPPSAALFHPPPPPPPLPSPSGQQPVAGGSRSTAGGPVRSTTTSVTRAAAANPYYRRTSSRGGSIPPPTYVPPPLPLPASQQTRTRSRASRTSLSTVPESIEVPGPEPLTAATGAAAGDAPATTAASPVVQIPEAPTVAPTRRTRSSSTIAASGGKSKPAVRFEEGTKATSRTTRRGSAGSVKNPDIRSTSIVASPIAAPPRASSVTTRATRATSDSALATGSGIPQPALPPPSPAPLPSTAPSALLNSSTSDRTQLQPQPQPHTRYIPTDMHYSPATHTLTVSLEMPGVKRSDLHVKLGTCYFNHIKYVVVLAKSTPVFGREDLYVMTGVRQDLNLRKEEEEEEEEEEEGEGEKDAGTGKMKTEIMTPTQSIGTPIDVDSSDHAPAAAGAGSSSSELATSTLLSEYGLPKLPKAASDAKDKGKGKITKIITATGKPRDAGAAGNGGSGAVKVEVGRIVNPNLRERRFGIMRRAIQVPQTTTLANINAVLEDGVLTLQIDFGPPFEIDDEVDVPVH